MPNYLHAREAIQALEAKKHLILEKPTAINREELSALRRAARKAETRSVVSFVARWHPMLKNLRALLDRKALGHIYYAEVDYWHGIKPTFASYPWIRRKEFAGGAMITGGLPCGGYRPVSEGGRGRARSLPIVAGTGRISIIPRRWSRR